MGPVQASAHVINSSANCIRYVACSGFCSGFLIPLRTSLECKSTLSLTDDRLSPGSATPTLFWHHAAGQAMLVCIPRVYLGVSCVRSGSQRFGLLQMCCLSRCQQYSLPQHNQALPQDWIVSSLKVKPSWVVALTDSLPCCGLSEQAQSVTWFGWEHMSRMSQETQQSLELTSVHTASKASKCAHALHKCPGFPKLSCQSFVLQPARAGLVSLV